MTTPNLPRPLNEEQAAEEAIADYFVEKKGVDKERAALYARLIAAEESEARGINEEAEWVADFTGISHQEALIWNEAKKRHPNVSPEDAKKMATSGDIRTPEMSPQLSKHIDAAREKTKTTLKQANANMILRGLEESLKGDDYFEVFAFMDDAKKMGVTSEEINKIIDATSTDLDREAIKKGELPLSAIA